MIKDLINNTKKNLRNEKIKNLNNVKNSNMLIVNFSDKIINSINEIRFFLKTKMYNNKDVLLKNNQGKKIIKKLFFTINTNPIKFISKQDITDDKFRTVSDFISGMTDRYAINLYKNIK